MKRNITIRCTKCHKIVKAVYWSISRQCLCACGHVLEMPSKQQQPEGDFRTCLYHEFELYFWSEQRGVRQCHECKRREQQAGKPKKSRLARFRRKPLPE